MVLWGPEGPVKQPKIVQNDQNFLRGTTPRTPTNKPFWPILRPGRTYLSHVMVLWTFFAVLWCYCVMGLLWCLCYRVIVLWTRQDLRVMVLWPAAAGAHNTAGGRISEGCTPEPCKTAFPHSACAPPAGAGETHLRMAYSSCCS